MERLDKYICGAELGTRKEVKELIRNGRVKVNGTVIKDTSHKVDENSDTVSADGKIIENKSPTYIVMNKPAGYICANSDPNKKTIFDILPKEMHKKGLFTVGRLDMDTVGLLIITNDGAFAHSVTSPKRHIAKTYYAEGEGALLPNASQIFAEGMPWGNTRLKPANLEVLETAGAVTKVNVTISEGKYHQVKRMLYNAGIKVTYLKRIKFGCLALPQNLKEGEARLLTQEELSLILSPNSAYRNGDLLSHVKDIRNPLTLPAHNRRRQ